MIAATSTLHSMQPGLADRRRALGWQDNIGFWQSAQSILHCKPDVAAWFSQRGMTVE
jgi:hypothetical protein